MTVRKSMNINVVGITKISKQLLLIFVFAIKIYMMFFEFGTFMIFFIMLVCATLKEYLLVSKLQKP